MNSGAANGDPAATDVELVSNTLRFKNLLRALWDVKDAGMVTNRAMLGRQRASTGVNGRQRASTGD